MTNIENTDVIESYTFKLLKVSSFLSLESALKDENTSSVLFLNDASGSLQICDKTVRLCPGLMIGASSFRACGIKLSPDAKAAGCRLTFQWLRTNRLGGVENDFSNRLWGCTLLNRETGIKQMKELKLLAGSRRPGDYLQAQSRLYTLLAQLFQPEEEDLQQRVTTEERLLASIEYMKEHYREPVTRDQLAAVAGLHPDYYSRAFKQYYKESPIRYLTNLRVYHAKSRLLHSNESSKRIAYDLGFNDEFYFSRKFKERMGISPVAYMKRLKQGEKIASLNHLTTGHLLALGITPYAAVLNNAFQAGNNLKEVRSVGQFLPDMDRLLDVKPEMILMRCNRDEAISSRLQQLDQIAPTLMLDFWQDWRHQLKEISRVIGRQPEALRFMERYEDKVQKIRVAVRKKIGSERVLLVGMDGYGQLYIFGRRNLGEVLYGDLEMQMPEGVDRIAHYIPVSLQELSSYQVERMILFSVQNDGSPKTTQSMVRRLNRLETSFVWNQFPAVAQGKVLCLLESGHLCTSYNAWSHERLLECVQKNLC